MPKRNCLAYLFVLAMLLFTWSGHVSASVPAEGGDLSRIVIADASDPVQTAAASDLQRVFAQITGQTLDIGHEPTQGRCLYIGGGPDELDLSTKIANLDEQGIYLSISSEHVICTGVTSEGIYNAVQELLYRIGYRKIWPGQYGECFPQGSTLKLGKPIEIIHNPSFTLRGGHTVQVDSIPGKKPSHISINDWTDWAARNHINRYKAGYCTTWDYGPKRGHGWQEIAGHSIQDIFLNAGDFGTKNPKEWYALYNGQRVAKHPIGTTVQPCVSNPDFVDHVTEIILTYFRTHPKAKRYMIGASDEPTYWCECDNCKALDPVQYPWLHEGGNQQERYHMSDRWFTMINTVADRVAVEFPDKWIATYAYASTREVPINCVPAKNVMVEVTIPLFCRKHKLTDTTCDANVDVLRRVREWQAVTPAISIYTYLEFQQWGMPVSFFDSAAQLYPALHAMGVRHISDEIDTTQESSPLYLGLWSRLLWDIETHADAYITEFCQIAYGEAAGDMERYWRTQQTVMQTSDVEHRGHIDLKRFTPEIIEKFNHILDESLKHSITEDQTARIKAARMALAMTTFYAAKNWANDRNNNGAWAVVNDARQQVYRISKDYGFPITLPAWNELGGGEKMFMPVPVGIQDKQYNFPTEALKGDVLVELPDQWMFRTDPEDVGITEEWFADGGSLKKFKPISISEIWEKQWPGNYDGYAWYVTDVVIPETTDKQVWLLFGAVDDSWKVWLVGNYIGASKGTPEEIWDKPAALNITGKYPPGLKIRLAVRVHDQARAGGIWRPVTIVTTDRP